MKFKFETFNLAGEYDAGGRTFSAERDFSDPPEAADFKGRLGLGINQARPEAVVHLDGEKHLSVSRLSTRTDFLEQIDNDDFAAALIASVRQKDETVET